MHVILVVVLTAGVFQQEIKIQNLVQIIGDFAPLCRFELHIGPVLAGIPMQVAIYVHIYYIIHLQLQTVTNAFRFVKSDEFFGVIGPSNPGDAAFWAPIFQRSNLMTVSIYFSSYIFTYLPDSLTTLTHHG